MVYKPWKSIESWWLTQQFMVIFNGNMMIHQWMCAWNNYQQIWSIRFRSQQSKHFYMGVGEPSLIIICFWKIDKAHKSCIAWTIVLCILIWWPNLDNNLQHTVFLLGRIQSDIPMSPHCDQLLYFSANPVGFPRIANLSELKYVIWFIKKKS